MIHRKDRFALIILILFQLGILWYFVRIPTHYHQDEFITAFTSWTLPPITKLDWFAAYPPVWVSQFPVLFHILQKPFFWIFGPTVTAVRISVWPYAIGILVYLYFLTKILYSRKLAIIVGIIYSAFAPHVYLSSMGLHFISSTFFYIAALTHFVAGQNVAAGIFSGAAYLTYTSSYITYPVIALIGIFTNRRGLVTTTLVALLILSPFLVYAATVNNFFTQRVSQVNALWGTWSDPAKQQIAPLAIIQKQTIDAFRSLVIPGVGGLGGYNFGKLGLLDTITAVLLAIGFIMLLGGAVKKSGNRIVLIALLVPFTTGFILTTHPPPFHRLSIIYPFLALIVGLTITRFRFVVVLSGIVIVANLLHTNYMIKADANIYPQNSRLIAEYITQNIPPGQPIQIAAYPSFYLGQELLFRTNNHYPITTGETGNILDGYRGGTLLLLNPTKENLDKLRAMYPNSSTLRSIDGVSLGDITLFRPVKK